MTSYNEPFSKVRKTSFVRALFSKWLIQWDAKIDKRGRFPVKKKKLSIKEQFEEASKKLRQSYERWEKIYHEGGKIRFMLMDAGST